MKQSYSKEQHTIASENQLPLVCIGFNGKYRKKPCGEMMFWGPASEAELKQVQALALKLCKSSGKAKR